MNNLDSSRNLSIDALRGFAIVLMLMQHTPAYLMLNPRGSNLYVYIFYISRIAAPLFFLIAGYCVAITGEKWISLRGSSGFMLHMVKRSFELFLLGFLVNVFRNESLIYFNVLHCIAFCILITGIFYMNKSPVMFVLLLSSLLIFSFFERLIPVKTEIESVKDVLLWFMTSGVFPFIFWLIYFVIGLGVGWYRLEIAIRAKNWLIFGSAMGIIFLLLFFIGHTVHYLPNKELIIIGASSLRLYPGHNNFIFIILTLSVCSFVFQIFSHLDSRKFINFMAIYGRHALFIYVCHQFLLQMIPRLVGINNRLPISSVIPILILLLGLLFLYLKKYEKFKLVATRGGWI